MLYSYVTDMAARVTPTIQIPNNALSLSRAMGTGGGGSGGNLPHNLEAVGVPPPNFGLSM